MEIIAKEWEARPLDGFDPQLYHLSTRYQKIQPNSVQPLSTTDEEVLLTDGTEKQKAVAATRYLAAQLQIPEEAAAGIVGNWRRESHLELGAENKAEKAGLSSKVSSEGYGRGIGQ